MANNNTSLRRTHSAPGVYFTEYDMTYATKSLGNTSLGLAGETVKGPAFQPIKITNWADYVKYFGGKNPAKFKGSQYPKYELPYIAQEYLKESQDLFVCRTLGLSGVNAGPAWILSAFKADPNDTNSPYTEDKPIVIGVLRSRGEHKKAAFVRAANPAEGICEDEYAYDEIEYFAEDVKIGKSDSLTLGGLCNPGFSTTKGTITMSANNYGTFTLYVKVTGSDEYKKYAISLNPWDKNYIYNVLGGDPEEGEAELYVEELYDVALQQLVEKGLVDSLFRFKDDTATDKNIINISDDTLGNILFKSEKIGVDQTVYNYNSTASTSNLITVTVDNVNRTLTKEDDGKIFHDKVNAAEKDKFYYAFNAQLFPIGLDTIYTFNGLNYSVTVNDASHPGESVAHTIKFEKYTANESLGAIVSNGEIIGFGADLHEFSKIKVVPRYEAVIDMVTKDESMLTRKDVGKRYLYSDIDSVYEGIDENSHPAYYPITVHKSSDNGRTWVKSTGEVGHIYTVISYIDAEGGRNYYYGEYTDKAEALTPFNAASMNAEDVVLYGAYSEVVEVVADGVYYMLTTNDLDNNVLTPITLDMNNYKDSYRYASTPWFVSEYKGSANHVELNKLFRFHTISDGATSNTEIKVSIENIDPTNGTFDVVVRDFYDSDASVVVLQKFPKCDLVPGSSNYIALKIGSLDGIYTSKSQYITVEVNENDKTSKSIPCGFMGYPVRDFNGNGIYLETKPMYNPYLAYNTNVDNDLHIRKQYFGMSDLVGIDEDVLKYKGVEAYNGLPSGLTPCFHLDSRIFNGIPDSKGIVREGNIQQQVTVDGIGGYVWSTVSKSNVTDEGIQPQIGSEADLRGTIYEDKKYRKFTACFYGGWDGWDYYRTSRSNSDEFTYRNYRGKVNSGNGEGANFSVIRNPEGLNFENNTKLITSDYYAYLAAIRQFSNPKTTYINVLATPGIDYVNNKLLVNDVINMVEDDEDRNMDTIYIVTTPDKPFGENDDVLSMYTPNDVVTNLEDSEIDSNCVATYYPWVKYYDQSNSQYVFLPPTKDVVRAIALTDRIAEPWYGAAGWNRGDINAEGPKKKLRLSEQDELYAGRINYINSFAEEGVDKLWGDKNLQVADSTLNRLSKRRALIRIKQRLSNAGITLLFDPNDAQQSKTFEDGVKKVMDAIMDKRGCSDYRLKIDSDPEAVDRLEINGMLYIKLSPNTEYINLGLVITPQGVDLSEM